MLSNCRCNFDLVLTPSICSLPSPFLINVALSGFPKKLIEVFGFLETKITTASLIKANFEGITALHSLCQNKRFFNQKSNNNDNLQHFKGCISWLIDRGMF